MERIDESIARYHSQLETTDRHGDTVPEAKVARLKGKIREAQGRTATPGWSLQHFSEIIPP
jgi:hypothetical protein